jgi:hypothetical protein
LELKIGTLTDVGVVNASDKLTERVLARSYLFFWEKSIILCIKFVISPLLY